MKSNNLSKIVFMLLFLYVPIIAAAQKVSVSGTVTDMAGSPLPGVSIIEKGTTTGTISDIDGNFSISVTDKSILNFTFIGYITNEIPVSGNMIDVKVVMEEDTKALEEVVVVGYGTMKRSDLTGSVVSVDEKAIGRSVPTSVDQVLQGRAAGVQISANSGTPGASTSIRIRGTNSLNATNQPIFVIDGVVVDPAGADASDPTSSNNPLASINPSDIVSMDVLKDASATAIYGARASNGVIMITTKRGKSGEATITYDGYVGWQQMAKKLDMMNLQQYAAHHNTRAEAHIVNASNQFVNVDALGEGTDWQDALFDNGAFMQSHNLSVTGGNEKNTYAMGAGYMNQDGIAVGSGFRRLTLRGNMDSQVKKWVKNSLSFSLTDSKQEVGADNTVILNALRSQPSAALTSADGSYDGPDNGDGQAKWMKTDNPIAMAKIKENFNKKLNFRINEALDFSIYKGITFKTELSADYNTNKFYYYLPDYSFGVLTRDQREGTWTNTTTSYWSWRNILNYSETFAEKHRFNAMLGQEMSHSHWESQVTQASGFLSNSAHDPSAGDRQASTGTGTQNNTSLFSYFGRIFYSFDEKYMLTFTLRRDGSSKFDEDHRWGWFPSAALAWKVSGEPFMTSFAENIKMNNFKIRLGWGSTGNQNVSDWQYISLLASKSTPWGSGVLAANTANPKLQWETTNSVNAGLDLNFFNNRIEFIFDYYYKKTKDLLLEIALPAMLGSEGNGAASKPWANIGSMENKGVEFTFNTINIDKKGFQWRSNIVFSHNKNKIVALDSESGMVPGQFSFGSDTWTITKSVVGAPVGQFYGYKVIGRFDKAEDFYYRDAEGNIKQVAIPTGSAIGENGVFIGDYIFEDINEDGVIDDQDQTVIGDPNPDFTFGFGNTFSYKGFDLTIYFNGSYGNDVFNLNNYYLNDVKVNSNVLSDAADYARLEVVNENLPSNDYRNVVVVNTGTKYPRVANANTNNNIRQSNRYVEDGSYIRLQNIALGYTLKKEWVKKVKLENVRVYANLQNVYTWTKYSGYDPEVGCMYGNALLNGLDYGRYPSPRIVTFGINVQF